jgi:hypothetical protein
VKQKSFAGKQRTHAFSDMRFLKTTEGKDYAEVPFCGLAVMEELSGHRTDVVDPFAELIAGQQPADDIVAFQKERLLRQKNS